MQKDKTDGEKRNVSEDPDATLRRQDPEATVRRPAADPDATQRRVSPSEQPPETEAQPASFSFPCEIDGRMVRLEVVRSMGQGGEGQLYMCTDGENLYAAKILQRDSDYQILDAMTRRQDLAQMHLVPCIWLGRMSDVYGTPLASGRYIIHPYYERGDMAALDNMRVINPSISYDGDESSFTPCAREYVHVECDYSAVDEDAFMDLVEQLSEGLAALHDARLVESSDGTMHRDIKPQNIFVAADGSYALGDFGLVSAMNAGVNQNFTERVGLSHGYSPPEAYSDPSFRQRVTRKYDYFSLGMTLLHIAGGRPRYIIDPAAGESDAHFTSLADYYEIIQSSNVDVPRQLPERVRSIIRGLITADSEDRWGGHEVRRWISGENPLVHESHNSSQSGISIYAEGRVHRGADEVADLLLREWARYRDELARGELTFTWDAPDPAYRKAVEHVIEKAQLQDPDIALQTLILTIFPKMGHVYQGRRYESDEALGRAMMEAASSGGSDYEFFADMLKKGALTSAWRVSSFRGSEKKQRSVMQIEEGAKKHPLAAMYAAGALLMGRSIDPVTIPTRYASLTFNSADHLFEWVQEKFGQAVDEYAEQQILIEEPPDIPGRWVLQDNTACLRQIDGSILVNSGRVLGPFPVSGELFALAQFALSPPDEPASRRAGERLYAILYRDGYLGTIGLPEQGNSMGGAGFMPETLISFLGMFPAVRGNHAFDDMFLKLLYAHVERLKYISAVKLPGAPKGQSVQADYEVQRVREAAARFDRTRRFEDFASAVRQANESREALVKIRTPNYDAAGRVLELAPLVMSSSDDLIRKRFEEILGTHRVMRGEPHELSALSEELDAFREELKAAGRRDLSPYLMSDTMLFIRNYNATSDEPLEIVLPDTTDAKEYFEELTAQVNRHRTRLKAHGVTDDEGRRRK